MKFALLISFVFNDTATTEIYPYCPPLSLPAALPFSAPLAGRRPRGVHRDAVSRALGTGPAGGGGARSTLQGPVRRLPPGLPHLRSEEHTSELQSLMRISYAVFCLKKKTQPKSNDHTDAVAIHNIFNTNKNYIT